MEVTYKYTNKIHIVILCKIPSYTVLLNNLQLHVSFKFELMVNGLFFWSIIDIRKTILLTNMKPRSNYEETSLVNIIQMLSYPINTK